MPNGHVLTLPRHVECRRVEAAAAGPAGGEADEQEPEATADEPAQDGAPDEQMTPAKQDTGPDVQSPAAKAAPVLTSPGGTTSQRIEVVSREENLASAHFHDEDESGSEQEEEDEEDHVEVCLPFIDL